MRNLLVLFFISLGLMSAAPIRGHYTGLCDQGGVQVSTATIQSDTKVVGSFPECTVAVYQPGTVTPVSIYSDQNGTTKANPFTADTVTGLIDFYADSQFVDISISGVPTPFTLANQAIFNPLTFPIVLDSNYASIAAACTAAGSRGIVGITFPHLALFNQTISCPLYFGPAGSLQVSNGNAITIAGGLATSDLDHAIFDLSLGGIIHLSNPQAVVYPQWFSNGITGALAAMTAGQTLNVLTGTYSYSSVTATGISIICQPASLFLAGTNGATFAVGSGTSANGCTWSGNNTTHPTWTTTLITANGAVGVSIVNGTITDAANSFATSITSGSNIQLRNFTATTRVDAGTAVSFSESTGILVENPTITGASPIFIFNQTTPMLGATIRGGTITSTGGGSLIHTISGDPATQVPFKNLVVEGVTGYQGGSEWCWEFQAFNTGVQIASVQQPVVVNNHCNITSALSWGGVSIAGWDGGIYSNNTLDEGGFLLGGFSGDEIFGKGILYAGNTTRNCNAGQRSAIGIDGGPGPITIATNTLCGNVVSRQTAVPANSIFSGLDIVDNDITLNSGQNPLADPAIVLSLNSTGFQLRRPKVRGNRLHGVDPTGAVASNAITFDNFGGTVTGAATSLEVSGNTSDGFTNGFCVGDKLALTSSILTGNLWTLSPGPPVVPAASILNPTCYFGQDGHESFIQISDPGYPQTIQGPVSIDKGVVQSGPTPTAAAGAGSGGSPGAITVVGSPYAGFLQYTTGTSPTTSAIVFTMTFASGYFTTAPNCIIMPAFGSQVLLLTTGPSGTVTTAVVNSGSVALPASTFVRYSYICPRI